MIRQQNTKKLFFNKWPIKVECHLGGSSWIARVGADRFIEWCNGGGFPLNGDGRTRYDRTELLKFAKIFKPFEGRELQLRGEGRHFNIFLKDTELLDEIVKALSPWIFTVTQPESDKELEYLLSNSPKKVICDQLPYEKYKFKVTLKENTPPETRTKFLEWLQRYDDKVHVSKSSLLWLENKKHWVQAPFFYIETAKHLSMVLLYLGSNIRKTQEYILKSSINT